MSIAVLEGNATRLELDQENNLVWRQESIQYPIETVIAADRDFCSFAACGQENGVIVASYTRINYGAPGLLTSAEHVEGANLEDLATAQKHDVARRIANTVLTFLAYKEQSEDEKIIHDITKTSQYVVARTGKIYMVDVDPRSRTNNAENRAEIANQTLWAHFGSLTATDSRSTIDRLKQIVKKSPVDIAR
jgi:hypothetical protein